MTGGVESVIAPAIAGPVSTPLTPLGDALSAAIAAERVADAAYYDTDCEPDGPEWAAAQAAEQVTAAARAALRNSDEPRVYSIRYRDSSGVTTTITSTPDQLDEAVENDVRSGDWSTDDSPCYVDIEVTCVDGYEERRTITIEVPEPECTDAHEHDWCSPLELVGGCADNPGVWGHGGGVIIHEVCSHCGTHRRTDTWAQRMDTGEQGLTEVSYELADDRARARVGRLVA